MRTAGDPIATIAALRAAVRDEEPAAIIGSIDTMDGRLRDQLAVRRFQTSLLVAFAVMAAVLAAAGIFGLAHHTVARREHELGVRMALGARAADVLGMVLREGAVDVLAGLAGGVVLSLWLTRLLSSLLYGVPPTDAFTFSACVVLLASLAFAATALPAWRASRTDPAIVLRQ